MSKNHASGGSSKGARGQFRGQSIHGGAGAPSIARGEVTFSTSAYNFEQAIVNTVTDGVVGLYDPSGSGAITLTGSGLNDQVGVQLGAAYQFKLNDMVGYLAKANMFDQYRIRSAEVELSYGTDSPGGSTWQYPDVWYVQDLDDGAAPVNRNVVASRSSAKHQMVIPGSPIRFTIRPKPSIPVYDGSVVGTGYSLGTNETWIDCADPGARYYGFKLWIQNLPSPPAAGPRGFLSQLKFIVKYHVEFKGQIT
jgi:hypothetical protein